MTSQSEFSIVAQMATLENDYDWYLIDSNRCLNETEEMDAILSSFRQLPNTQPLIALQVTKTSSYVRRWSISIGPISTPWRDPVFGRTIRVRLIVSCVRPDFAYKFFEWAVLKWWDERSDVPAADVKPLEGSHEAQLNTIVQWLEQQVLSPMSKHESSLLVEDSSARVKRQPARNVTAVFSESNRNDLLTWVRRRLIARPFPAVNSSESLAAISEGLVPDYHKNTQLSLGVEDFYPTKWSQHNRVEVTIPSKSLDKRSHLNEPYDGTHIGRSNTTIVHLTQEASLGLLRILIALTKRSSQCLPLRKRPAKRSEA